MTKIFNLESLTELYQYTQFWGFNPEDYLPKDGEIPRKYYQDFLSKHLNLGYRAVPSTLENCQPNLELKANFIPLQTVGNTTANDNEQSLFIIRDTANLINLKNLFQRDQRYLYSSAYYYWNYYSQLEHIDVSYPVIFIDLNRFGEDWLLPIGFVKETQYSYAIPFIDARSQSPIYISLKNFQSQLYQKFACLVLDAYGLSHYKLTVENLSKYLRKQNFLAFLEQHRDDEYFSFLIEINLDNQIYFRNFKDLVEPFKREFNQSIIRLRLDEIAQQHSDYQFVLISHFVDDLIKAQFQSSKNIFLVKHQNQEFNYFLKQKKAIGFPLFALALDQIEFMVKDKNGKLQWIQVPSEGEEPISWEGQTSKTFRGRFAETRQDFFKVTKTAILPIKINGQDYLIDGKPQQYRLDVVGQNNNQFIKEHVEVFIEFIISPGSQPQLFVKDRQDKYLIQVTEEEYKEIEANPNLKAFISIQEMNDARFKKSEAQTSKIKNNTRLTIQIRSCLIGLSQENRKTEIKALYESLKNHLSPSSDDCFKCVLPSFISNYQHLKEIKEALELQQINNIIDGIKSRLQKNQSKDKNENPILLSSLICLGNIYSFTYGAKVSGLFKESMLNFALHAIDSSIKRQFFYCLARIAINNKLILKYFSWFHKANGTKELYRDEDYLWGYSRMLLWYFDYAKAINSFDYYFHFSSLLNHLLDLNVNDVINFNSPRYQNPFLSLICLLTFRQIDQDFVREGSQEYILAEQVVQKYKDKKIILKQVGDTEALNEIFEKLLHGSLSSKSVPDLVAV